MVILISNDDGIYARGLQVLYEELKSLGKIYVVAPDRERSAVSHALSLHRPLRIKEVKKNFFAVDGTPTDCVNIAINGLLPEKPDMVVSGINFGPNLGDDITYSGTVSAAIEGCLLGVPSIAFSLATLDPPAYFRPAGRVARRIVEKFLETGIPQGTIINVNFPNKRRCRYYKGLKFTRQGKRKYGEAIVEKIDPRGKKYYWIGGKDLGYENIPDSDIVAVEEGYVSITPIHLDLTNYRLLQELKKWEDLWNQQLLNNPG